MTAKCIATSPLYGCPRYVASSEGTCHSGYATAVRRRVEGAVRRQQRGGPPRPTIQTVRPLKQSGPKGHAAGRRSKDVRVCRCSPHSWALLAELDPAQSQIPHGMAIPRGAPPPRPGRRSSFGTARAQGTLAAECLPPERCDGGPWHAVQEVWWTHRGGRSAARGVQGLVFVQQCSRWSRQQTWSTASPTEPRPLMTTSPHLPIREGIESGRHQRVRDVSKGEFGCLGSLGTH